MARDERKSSVNWRAWVRGFAWTLLFCSAVAAARAVSNFMRTDPRFAMAGDIAVTENGPDFAIHGLVYSSRARVAAVFRQDFGRNIFEIPAAERRRKLLAVDWVRDASVSRLWPNRIVVRIWERNPLAFVTLSNGTGHRRTSRLALIDGLGVIMEQPAHSDFSFPILTGIYEQQTEKQRQARLQHYLRLMKELDSVARDISEVDVSETANLKITMDVGGRAIELLLGQRNFAKNVRDFLKHYSAEIQKGSPEATTFDLRLDDRITAED